MLGNNLGKLRIMPHNFHPEVEVRMEQNPGGTGISGRREELSAHKSRVFRDSAKDDPLRRSHFPPPPSTTLNMSQLLQLMEKLSTHRCKRCNRPLTDPESIRIGIGPICLTKMKRGYDLWDHVWETFARLSKEEELLLSKLKETGALEEIMNGNFNVDDLKAIEAKLNMEVCSDCKREDCQWFLEQENDHKCRGFVRGAILAQVEDLEREEGVDLLMEIALEQQGLYIKTIVQGPVAHDV